MTNEPTDIYYRCLYNLSKESSKDKRDQKTEKS